MPLLAGILVSACGTNPQALSSPTSDTACIAGGMADLATWGKKGHTSVMEEGRWAGGPYANHCFPAGEVTFVVFVSLPMTGASERIRMTLVGGRQYRVRAIKVERSIDVRIFDVRVSGEQLTHQLSLPEYASPKAGVVVDVPEVGK